MLKRAKNSRKSYETLITQNLPAQPVDSGQIFAQKTVLTLSKYSQNFSSIGPWEGRKIVQKLPTYQLENILSEATMGTMLGPEGQNFAQKTVLTFSKYV